MARLRISSKVDRAAEHGPYCAFRSDRDRLWALISRDIRLVLIAVVIGASRIPASWLPF